MIKLPKTAELASLFASMTPYFDPKVKPVDDLMQLKLQEGLLALLHINKKFAPTLFDFNEPWKIDILEFMNENYMYELTMEEMAHYTGRSLATFKRDFKKISDLTPEKWFIRKRLEVAYALMKEGGKRSWMFMPKSVSRTRLTSQPPSKNSTVCRRPTHSCKSEQNILSF